MAQEPIYRPQIGPARPTGLPRASASAFGAGIGAATEDLGSSLVRAREIERRNQADSEAASFNLQEAQLLEEAERMSLELRNSPDAVGGQGHDGRVATWWQERTGTMLDGITNTRVRQQAEARLASAGARFRSAEHAWAEGARVNKLVTDTRQAKDIAVNRVSRGFDAERFGDEMERWRQSVGSLENVPPHVREALEKEGSSELAYGYLAGGVDAAPKVVLTLLDGGSFDDLLSPEQQDRLRNGATTAIRAQEAAARAEAAQALALKREELATRRAELDAGAGTPQDWADLAGEFDAIGDSSSAVTARAAGTSRAAAIGYRGETLPQLDSRITTLTAKRNGDGLSTAEASTLSGLQDLRGQLAGMLGQPGGALLAHQFATGKPIAPLDTSDPASLRTRAMQAKAAAQRYGRVTAEPILPTELPTFKDLMGSGVQQRLAALGVIQGFGDPQVIRAAAAQIAGEGDSNFRIAAQLPMDVARDVLRGGETLQTRPQVWDQRKATADFSKWYGSILGSVGGSYRTDVFEAAKAFYAQRVIDGGEQAYNPGRFAEAIETVMGKSGTRGGVVHHPRGVVLVPQGMDRTAFMQRLARATPEQYTAAAGGHGAKWSDGSWVTRAEFAKLLPTAVDGAGHYGFRGPGGRFVANERGEPYVIDIHRLGK